MEDKAGRRSSLPKSFRPISLTFFLLKTNEKLIDMHIIEEMLRSNLLHIHQYAYQKLRSTTNALQNLVSNIESSMDAKKVAVDCFLNIERRCF